MLDITCTATLRPELLKITLGTFAENLFRNRLDYCRLIINIDQIGAEDKEAATKEVIEVAESFGFGRLTIRISREPHFGKAFVWCMQEVESELFFNLEEDWKLLMWVDFDRMHEIMLEDLSIAHLRLSAFPSTELTCKNWNKFLLWNGKYFAVPEDLRGTIGWAGHPSLNRKEFIHECLGFMDSMFNPEKQIKGRRYNHPMNDIIKQYRFGSFHPQNSAPSVEDIGRKWMLEHDFVKSGNKAVFTNWEKVNNT